MDQTIRTQRSNVVRNASGQIVGYEDNRWDEAMPGGKKIVLRDKEGKIVGYDDSLFDTPEGITHIKRTQTVFGSQGEALGYKTGICWD